MTVGWPSGSIKVFQLKMGPIVDFHANEFSNAMTQ